PKPNQVNPGSFEDYTIRYAKDHGKTVDQLNTADLRQARKEWSAADNKPDSLGAGMGANGALTDEGVDYAATQYRVTGVMPALGMGNAQARAAIINKAAEQAKTLGLTPAAAIQKQAAYKADAASLTKMRTFASSAEAFDNKALQQADIVENLSSKVGRTSIPIVN